jgi:hypothetical protein
MSGDNMQFSFVEFSRENQQVELTCFLASTILLRRKQNLKIQPESRVINRVHTVGERKLGALSIRRNISTPSPHRFSGRLKSSGEIRDSDGAAYGPLAINRISSRFKSQPPILRNQMTLGANLLLIASLSIGLLSSRAAWGQSRISSEVAAVHLQTEMRNEPLNIETKTPHLSWLLQGREGRRGLYQSAYEIQLAPSISGFTYKSGDSWDSGKVTSGQYIQIEYQGRELHSHQQYSWRVRVWDNAGRKSGWSQAASFTTGMLHEADWQAKWIEPESSQSALPLFRREFNLRKPVARAVVYVSGLGQYELRLNGRNVTDAVLTPGWSGYNRTVLYNAYDITRLVQPGANVFGAMLGNGMYNVPAAKGRYAKFTGSFGEPKLILQAHFEYQDGTEDILVSDHSWSAHPGPIVFSSVYGGEDFDATKAMAGWDRPGFPAAGWTHAIEIPGPSGKLRADASLPIRVAHRYSPVRVTEPKPGVLVYDLGQNFSGWPEVTMQGHAGQTIRLIPGELLDANGLVSQRSAGVSPDHAVFFQYTLGSSKPETWHPRFTYYGFRYVQLEGGASARDHRSGKPRLLSLRGDFVHADMPLNGEFTSSEDQLNRIHHLIDMAILSNSVSIITDCPHREKLGWLEQTYLNGSSIFFNYDASLLYEKMARDITDAQIANGMVPAISPEYVQFVDSQGRDTAFRDSPEWGSASILSPWIAYQFSEDRRLLADSYDTMKRYAGYLGAKVQDHLLSYGLGDWFDIGPDSPGESQLTTKTMTASATYYADLQALARIAHILEKQQEAAGFESEAQQVKSALNAELFHPETNSYDRGSQTANAMALVLHLVPEGHEQGVLQNLVDDIHLHHDHVTAGDVGFHYVVRALTEMDRSDVIYALLMRNDSPSYGYQLQHGATTLTEAWDANPLFSQNHFMLGHAEEWFYRGLAGIRTDMDSLSIHINPSPVGDVHSVSAVYRSGLGPIRSSWKREEKQLLLDIEIPVGAHAEVLIPTTDRASIRESGRKLSMADGIHQCRSQAGGIACDLESGRYQFTSAF